MAAEVLARGGASVTVIDHMPSPARKFLMAGRGGLNLTHSEPLDAFLARYGAARGALEPAIRAFPPERLRQWADELDAETFVGSSGRVFPKAMKASPLLRAWLRRLDGLGVRFKLRGTWAGFDGTPAILAMGGASWPRLGSDGAWAGAFKDAGIAVAPFGPSNCAVRIAWSDYFKDRFAGQPLKLIGLSCNGTSVRGEAVVTRDGLEGGAVYALSPLIRANPGSDLVVDLLPGMTEQKIEERLASARKKDSQANRIRKALGLSPAAIALLKEGEGGVKALALKATGVAGLERAISSSGGIAWEEVDDRFMLKKRPGVFVCGEMLDWEAQTGGYLLQACFSTGAAAAKGCLDWLAASAPHS
jgi:uncharacterized flavoprotein (TIGR03862 family)